MASAHSIRVTFNTTDFKQCEPASKKSVCHSALSIQAKNMLHSYFQWFLVMNISIMFRHSFVFIFLLYSVAVNIVMIISCSLLYNSVSWLRSH